MGSRTKRALIIGVGFLVMMCILLADWKINGTKALQRQNKVMEEFDEIRPIPGALLITKNSNYKTAVGGVNAVYEIKGVGTSAIEQWYAQEFDRLHWVPLGEKVHLSKRRKRFCRNGETAILILPEQITGSQMEYEVQVGWGGPYKC